MTLRLDVEGSVVIYEQSARDEPSRTRSDYHLAARDCPFWVVKLPGMVFEAVSQDYLGRVGLIHPSFEDIACIRTN